MKNKLSNNCFSRLVIAGFITVLGLVLLVWTLAQFQQTDLYFYGPPLGQKSQDLSLETVLANPGSSSPVTITTSLYVNASGTERPHFDSELEIQVPADWPEVIAIQKTSPGDADYRDALGSFFERLSLPWRSLDFYSLDEDTLRSLSINQDVATFVFTETGAIYNLTRDHHLIGLFEVKTIEDQFDFRFLATDAPIWTHRIVEFDVAGMTLDDFIPLPGWADCTDPWTWDFPEGAPSIPIIAKMRLAKMGLPDASSFSYSSQLGLPQASGLATVTTKIDISASGTDYPQVKTEAVIQVPANWPGVYRLQEHSPQSRIYWEGFDLIMWTLGIFDSIPLSSALSEEPDLKLDSNCATITFTETTGIYSLSSRERISIIPLFVEPFKEDYDLALDRDSMYHISVERDPNWPVTSEFLLRIEEANIPTWTTWIVDLNVDGLEIESAAPMPESDNGKGKLTWTLNSNSDTSEIAMRVKPQPRTGFRLIANSGMWRYLPRVSWYVAPAIVLFFVPWALSRYGQRRSTGILGDAERRLKQAVSWALLLFVSVGILTVVGDFFEPRIALMRFGSTDMPSFLSTILWALRPSNIETPIFLVAYAIFFIKASQALGRKNVWSALLWLIIGLLIVNLQSAVRYVRPADVFLVLKGPLLLLPVCLITYYAIVGILRFVIALWPEDSLQRLYEKKWLHIALLALVIAVAAQWLWSKYEDLNPWQQYAFTEQWKNLWRLLSGEEILGASAFDLARWFEPIESSLMFYPHSLLHQVIDLLPFIGLAGLVGILFTLSRETNSIFFQEKHWAIKVPPLLFAGIVVGSGGFFVGFRIPLAFFVSLLITRFLLTRRLEQAAEEIERDNPELSGGQQLIVLTYHKELLQRAKALENLERQQASLYDKYSQGELDGDTYYKKSKKILAEKKRFTIGVGPSNDKETDDETATHKSQSTLAEWLSHVVEVLFSRKAPDEVKKPVCKVHLPDGFSPNQLALSLGPRGALWENGTLAAKIGARLAILPVGFYIYVLLTERVIRFLSPSSFGLLNLVEGLLNEVAFWLVAAFVLGCLYPYLRGPNGAIKGTLLAVVYTLSRGSNELVNLWLGQGVSMTWTSRALQLLLFLVVVGVIMDWYTLKEKGIYWRNLLDYYQLRDARTVVGYLSPLAVALFLIGQQLVSGEAQKAVVEIIKSLPQAIPGL